MSTIKFTNDTLAELANNLQAMHQLAMSRGVPAGVAVAGSLMAATDTFGEEIALQAITNKYLGQIQTTSSRDEFLIALDGIVGQIPVFGKVYEVQAESVVEAMLGDRLDSMDAVMQQLDSGSGVFYSISSGSMLWIMPNNAHCKVVVMDVVKAVEVLGDMIEIARGMLESAAVAEAGQRKQ